jgi:hypothetical protein
VKEYAVGQGEGKEERRKDQQASTREIGTFKLKINWGLEHGSGVEGDPFTERCLEKAKLSLR